MRRLANSLSNRRLNLGFSGKRLAIFFCVAAFVSAEARAQSELDAAQLLPVPGILRNSVTNLHAEGDSLWTGPFLNLTTDGGETWFVAETDSLWGTRNSVYSIDAEGDVIWVGIGHSRQETQGSVAAASGFLFSEDAGRTFTYRAPQLDRPDDTSVQYGVSTLPALAIVVPEQSPPYDIDYDPETGDVWVAAWASGVRRSQDEGRTWDRVVLPPDSLEAIDPNTEYDFTVAPQRGSSGHLNHMGFSILVDETGTIWAGTPRGLNRSTDGGASWQRFSAESNPESLTGSWVISIEEQPLEGRNPIWLATWNAGEAGESGRFGITVTRDGGETFEQQLLGERVYDFAFRGESTVYAAGETGLFISEDDGVTWRTVNRYRDVTDPSRFVRPDVNVFAVATTTDALWVGTSDGLMKSEDGGETWRIHRTNVPLHPDEPTETVPDVDTYAYPNPFSPQADRFVRIRYESDGGSDEIRIFDFKMNLVRTLANETGNEAAREVAWDGTDENGFRVSNGVYFYIVDAGGEAVRGKIHVLE